MPPKKKDTTAKKDTAPKKRETKATTKAAEKKEVKPKAENKKPAASAEAAAPKAKAGQKRAKPTDSGSKGKHYILMLDDSGSMSGTPWRQLTECVFKFMDSLEQDSTNPKLSVIIYNSFSRIAFENKELKNVADLKKLIKYEGGGTDFDAAMRDADKICKNSESEFDEIVFYFMSDGESSYPDQAIKDIKS